MKDRNNIALWSNLLEGSISKDVILQKYLCKEIDLQELINTPLNKQVDKITSELIKILLGASIENIIEILYKAPKLIEVTTSNIPQFSNFASAVIYLPKLLLENSNGYTYQELGYALHSDCNSDLAARKYGENHSKLAIALDLATPTIVNGFAAATHSVFSIGYCKLSQSEKEEILMRLCYRIPIIQHAAISNDRESSIDKSLEVLASSTRTRRKRNVKELLAYALNE